MPQKKNPDVAELIRGKTGRAYGNLANLLTLMKGLPLAYNRDMQEDKEPVFDSARTVKDCLTGANLLLRGMAVNEERMRAACDDGYLTATDLADYLARKGVPFRKAHEITGRIVRHCEVLGARLKDLSLKELRSFSKVIGEDVPQRHLPLQLRAPAEDARRDGRRGGPGAAVVAPQEVMPLARTALALAVLLSMLGSSACGRKAMPEPRKSESSSAILIGAR